MREFSYHTSQIAHIGHNCTGLREACSLSLQVEFFLNIAYMDRHCLCVPWCVTCRCICLCGIVRTILGNRELPDSFYLSAFSIFRVLCSPVRLLLRNCSNFLIILWFRILTHLRTVEVLRLVWPRYMFYRANVLHFEIGQYSYEELLYSMGLYCVADRCVSCLNLNSS